MAGRHVGSGADRPALSSSYPSLPTHPRLGVCLFLCLGFFIVDFACLPPLPWVADTCLVYPPCPCGDGVHVFIFTC